MGIIVIYIASLLLAGRFFSKNVFSKFLCWLYAVCGITTILFFILDPENIFFTNVNYYPIIYLLFVVLIFINSFNGIEKNNFNCFDNAFYIYRISKYVCMMYFPCTMLLLYNACVIILTQDISTYRVEENYYANLFGGKFLSLSIYLSELSFVPHLLLFENIKNKCLNRWVLVLLLFASMSFVFSTLCFSGRDGIVYWMFNSVVLYMLYSSVLSQQTKIKVRTYGLIILLVSVVIFISISVQRFVVSGNFENMLLPIMNYSGQSLPLFCKSYMNLNYVENLEVGDSDYYLKYTFATFVREFMFKFGILGTLLVSILFNLVVKRFSLRYNKNGSIWILLIIFSLYQIPLYGVFYYRHGIQSMELVCGIFIFICLFFNRYKKIKFI